MHFWITTYAFFIFSTYVSSRRAVTVILKLSPSLIKIGRQNFDKNFHDDNLAVKMMPKKMLSWGSFLYFTKR